MLNEYLNLVSEIVIRYGYLILFFGVIIENIFLLGILFPGLFILTICGFLSANNELNLAITIIVGYLGTLTGDNLSYTLGRIGFVKIGIIKRFSTNYSLVENKLFSSKQTTLFLLFYHFPIYARMIVPALLGILKYSFKKWFFINSLGALIFSTTFILLGYFIGQTSKLIDQAIDISKIIQWIFFFLFFYFVFSFFNSLKKLSKKKNKM
ncbi:MAG: hypothetical protein A2W90_04865 [Bacteroidetes bacterium GWF2_42_66]|nr:MAG: hypothetical protein A2W89_21085 [Bacteroidetes bacterium GWE2_42_39]OFY40818.1 MAG: hypothetical protein A2W90_04865 [Bacteroidetes bacterium GWF2_42_66]HAZ00586.1 hypothetical protein [Marinilabiliales bacterium]HBL75837.1 hypothetical protein [Prolixibacteraceae bacterium]HCU63086.1 hypothetical protein [Prolixibacteraceae bacterium]